jgi:hypothetical protein
MVVIGRDLFINGVQLFKFGADFVSIQIETVKPFLICIEIFCKPFSKSSI